MFRRILIFKIILVFLITVTFLLIYFQISGQINFNRLVYKKSEINFDIQSLIKNDLVNLDNGNKLNDLVENESNVALKYYNEWKSYPSDNKWKETDITTCDTELPTIEEIDFNNIFWQTIPNTNKTQYFLYNAFYDNRGTDKYVRVVVVVKVWSESNLWSVIRFQNAFYFLINSYILQVFTVFR